MRNSGLTIVEVTIITVITAIVVLAVGANLVAAHYFRATTHDTIELSREARIATNHMARVLRFAKPGTITAGEDEISATVDSGHLLLITSDNTDIVYTRTANNTLTYTQDGVTNVIAGGGESDIDIIDFDGIWYSLTSEIEIELTAEKEGRSISVQTRILVLGEQ